MTDQTMTKYRCALTVAFEDGVDSAYASAVEDIEYPAHMTPIEILGDLLRKLREDTKTTGRPANVHPLFFQLEPAS